MRKGLSMQNACVFGGRQVEEASERGSLAALVWALEI